MIGQRRLSIVFGIGLLLSSTAIGKLLFKFWRYGSLLATYEIEIVVANFLGLIGSPRPVVIHDFQLSFYLRLFDLLMNLSIIFVY